MYRLSLLLLVIGIMFVVQARASGGEKIYTSRKAVTDCETMIASEKATTENIKEQIKEAELLLAEYENDKFNEEENVVEKQYKR